MNKKTNTIVSVRYRFKEIYFNDTILDGELLKDNDNNWIFSVIDIIVDKGNCVDKYPLNHRLVILEDMISNHFQKDTNMDVADVELKKYFEYKYINDLYDTYKEKLSYRCSGFIFKNIIIYEKYLLYIFQENRTKKSITLIKKCKINNSNEIISFNIKKTDLPDIFELYCSKDESMYKYGIASINTFACSKFVNGLFEQNNNEAVYVRCSYHKVFDKWIPYEQHEDISDYNIIKGMESEL